MKNKGVINKDLKKASTYYLSKISHEKEVSSGLYEFMKTYKIGESEYGKIMDMAAEGKKVMAHRLYGHHIVYDFPKELNKVPDFLLHEISDLFTDMGLPILPGEMLENSKLIDYCKQINKPNWNFINGFDILVATAAIYSGSKMYAKVIKEEIAVEDIKDIANTFGVGTIEFALACSTANPFLLLGSFLHIASGIKGIFNDGAIIYFNKVTNHYRLEVVSDKYSMEYVSNKNTIKYNSQKNTMDYFHSKNKMG
uniref:Uncharacterized protein n=1 Tax=uncultured organism TaxID=155900 RepID=M1PP67_9ZZZZ|nr:hypothetical protein FLSS-3_0011 [uncultured organism]